MFSFLSWTVTLVSVGQAPGCNIISVSLLFWTLGMTSTLLTGNAYSCVTLYLSSVLNSVPDLPSIRRAAVQAWLETVSGGSLVMFVLFPLTITTVSWQLC